ncbi:uncharacterized protein LOC116028601 [Ipomoea triloba]|uniref:uncharacterized protein LOC116028601 n=1 Tax=Ipomoea triloba TaxID=35885 RepID=UPI00125E023F|nr:uncharacterized protein LOC116028601 [Ipomoea triloba]
MVRDLGSNRYLFTFYHERDIARVLSDGPWTFDQNLVLLRRLEDGDDPMIVALTKASFWIQMHDVPVGFMSDKVARMIGNHVGIYEQSDSRSFDGIWRTFIRVRTTIDVTKPLKAKMKMKKPGGEWFWVTLRYERLPSFCFHCGIIGHADKFCPEAFDKPMQSTERPFGSWMRAGGRRGGTTTPNKWLVLDQSTAGMSARALGRSGSPVTSNEKLMQQVVGNMPLHGLNVDNDEGVRACEGSGELNAEGGSEGVVFTDQKRKKTISEGESEESGPGIWNSPMIVEEVGHFNSEEVGSGFQAHRAQ